MIDDFEAKLILEQNLKNLKKAKKQKYTDESDNEYCILNSEAECDTEDEEEEEDEEMQKKCNPFIDNYNIQLFNVDFFQFFLFLSSKAPKNFHAVFRQFR